jgi:hypothetical protein
MPKLNQQNNRKSLTRRNQKNNQKHKKQQRAGSLASQRVMSLTPKTCQNSSSSMIEGKITSHTIRNNYGSVYKTTGGKRRSRRTIKGGGRTVLPPQWFNPKAEYHFREGAACRQNPAPKITMDYESSGGKKRKNTKRARAQFGGQACKPVSRHQCT